MVFSVASIDDGSSAEGDAGISFSINDGVLTVSGNGPMSDYLPYSVNPQSAAPWAKGVFNKVVINEGITSVGAYAFYDTNVDSVSLPSTVESIHDYAFSLCDYLTSIELNEGLTSIGKDVFAKTPLSKIVIPGTLESIPNDCFRIKELTTVSINNGVKSIGDYAFYGTNLSSITFPESIKEIGSYAFGNTPLKGFMCMGVCNFDDFAFQNCKNIILIVLHDKYTFTPKTFDGTDIKLDKFFEFGLMTVYLKSPGSKDIAPQCTVSFAVGDEIVRTDVIDFGTPYTSLPYFEPLIDIPRADAKFKEWDHLDTGAFVTGDVVFHALFDILVKSYDIENRSITLEFDSTESVDVSKELFDQIVSDFRNDLADKLIIKTGKASFTLDKDDILSMDGSDPIFILDEKTEYFNSRSIDLPFRDIAVYNLDVGMDKIETPITVDIPYYNVDDGYSVIVRHMLKDGGSEAIECTYSDGAVTFDAKDFSDYVILTVEDHSSDKVILAGSIIGIVLVSVLALFLYKRD